MYPAALAAFGVAANAYIIGGILDKSGDEPSGQLKNVGNGLTSQLNNLKNKLGGQLDSVGDELNNSRDEFGRGFKGLKDELGTLKRGIRDLKESTNDVESIHRLLAEVETPEKAITEKSIIDRGQK